eukprot:13836014-Alexandrium_andersonii.AAC.1
MPRPSMAQASPGEDLDVPIVRAGYVPRDGDSGLARAIQGRDRVASSSTATASSTAPGLARSRRA